MHIYNYITRTVSLRYIAAFVAICMASTLIANSIVYVVSAQSQPLSNLSTDMNGDSVTDIYDLSYVLAKWGTNDNKADLNKDGSVNLFDLSRLFSRWAVSVNEVSPRTETTPVFSAPEVVADTSLETGSFFVSGTQIIDPNGDVFYPIGINVNGPESWNNRYESLRTVGHVDDAKRWGFNTVRLTMCIGQGDRNGGNYPDDNLEAIIDEYTPEGIVVMLEGRYDCSKAGTPPTQTELTAVRNEFENRARQYADNPYVWFNLFNEPTRYVNDPNHTTWRDIHIDVAQAIRNTGATNMIVVNGSNYGQENHSINGYDFTDEADSAILRYGDDVMQAVGECNVAFSFHVYTEWKNGSSAMEQYIEAVQASGKALLIGEVGVTENASTAASMQVDTWTNLQNARTAYEVAPRYGVGVLAWHGAATDSFNLTYENGNGPTAYWSANDDFSNLTEFGSLHRDLAERAPSFTVDRNASVPNCLQ